jgi:hypothetical protein
MLLFDLSLLMTYALYLFYLKLLCYLTFVNLLQGSTYQSLYTYKYFHDVNL